MRILNIEDDAIKHRHICNALQECGLQIDVDWVTTLNEAYSKITEATTCKQPYDLYITDMEYPVSGRVKSGDLLSGELFIRKMKEEQNSTPIILCSAINYKFPDVYGSVYYSDRSDWEAQLKKLVRDLAQ